MTRGKKPDGTWQIMEYDAAGRLITVKRESDGWIQQSNSYGSSRQRVGSWSYASPLLTWHVWGGDSVLAEYTSTSWGGVFSWAKSYIYAGSRLLSTLTNNGAGGENIEYHHPDRLGTKLVTNNAANTSFEQSTLPFGTALNAESSGFSNQVFTSYERSDVANLDYAVNRTYSSGQGRFTQADPIGMDSVSLRNPQSLNLFAYVKNLPTDLIDPNGLCGFGEVDTVELTCNRVDGGKWECSVEPSCRQFNSRAGNSSGGGGGINVDKRRGGPIGPGSRPSVDPPSVPPPPPPAPKDPCGVTTDINGSAGILTFGLQIGDHAVYPYVGFTLAVPTISGSLTHSPSSSPSRGTFINGSAGGPGLLGVTRSVQLTSLGSVGEFFNPNSNVATHTVGAMSPQASVSVIRTFRIALPNGLPGCQK